MRTRTLIAILAAFSILVVLFGPWWLLRAGDEAGAGMLLGAGLTGCFLAAFFAWLISNHQYFR